MSRVLLKKSSVAGKVPVTSLSDPANGLEYGELALNYADGKLYFKNSSNVITSFSSGNDLSAILDRRLYTVTTAGSNTLSVNYVVGFIDVFVNGVKLNNTEFTATSGAAVVIPDLSVNDEVQLVGYLKFSLTGLTISGSGLAFDANAGLLTINSATTATANTLALRDGSGNLTATNLSGTNTGDNAVNSLYSGLVTNATHTGDATGSTALTLATVNTNVGAFGSATNIPVVTVNAKGLVTAVSTVAVSIPSGAITITGDVTGSGTTGSSTTLTLATVNSNIGTWNNVTVNAKGLVTGGSNTAYLTSYTESDTLATVTGRGATTTSAITIQGTINGLKLGAAGTALNSIKIGDNSSLAITTGQDNVAIGNSALRDTTTGSNNTAYGRGTLILNVSGSSHTAVGGLALALTTGTKNTGVGYNAGGSISTGSSNTVIGSYSGYDAPINQTGSNYVVLSDGDANVRAYWNGANPTFPGAMTLSDGTANGVAYLNGSKVLTTGPALAFDGTNSFLGIGPGVTPSKSLTIYNPSIDTEIRLQSGTKNFYLSQRNSSGQVDYIVVDNTAQTWSVNNAEGMRLTSTGLGIGTTSPARTLDVFGYMQIQNPNGVEIAPVVLPKTPTLEIFGGDANENNPGSIGLVTPGLNVTAGQVRGSELYFVSSRSTTTQLAALTYTALAAGDNIGRIMFGGDNGVNLRAAGATISGIAGSTWSATNAEGYLTFSTTALNATASGERMRLTSDGNLGIGTTSPISSVRLTLVGGGVHAQAVVANGSPDSYADAGGLMMSYASGVGSIKAYSNTAGTGSTSIVFQTAGTTQVTLDSSGNLGLGLVPSGTYKFQNSGNTFTTGITISTGGGTNVANTVNIDTNGSGAARYYSHGANASTVGSHEWHLASSSGSIDTQAMTLITSGNLGVNTTTPSEKLEVVGNIKHTGLVMTAGTNVDQIYTASDVLTLTTAWQDTSVNSAELTTGSYMVQVYADDNAVGGGHYYTYYTGIMSWYSADTNEASSDEIVLHRAGHASTTGNIFLRVLRTFTADLNNMKLQIAGITANTGTSTYTYKFRRLI